MQKKKAKAARPLSRLRRLAFVFDTVFGIFAYWHAEWLCEKFGVPTQKVGEKTGRLFDAEKRRFADALFDAGAGIWVHLEFQLRYVGDLILRMLEYKALIHRIHGQMHLVQAVLFMRRPPKNVRDRLTGTPTDYGFLWKSLDDFSAEELLGLETPIATVVAIGCPGDREATLNRAADVLAALDGEEREHLLKLCRAMASLRPNDSEEFINDLKMKVEFKEVNRVLTDKHWEAVDQTLMLQAKRKARREGRKEGLKEGREEGLKEGIENSVLSMHAKGMAPEQIAYYLDLSHDQVSGILNGKNGKESQSDEKS